MVMKMILLAYWWKKAGEAGEDGGEKVVPYTTSTCQEKWQDFEQLLQTLRNHMKGERNEDLLTCVC